MPEGRGAQSAADDGRAVIGRLLRRGDFLRVQAGRSCGMSGFMLKASPRPLADEDDRGLARFGFTVTRRLGSAVVRNRARRRLREAVRLVAPELAQGGFDYVLIGRQGAIDQGFGELLEDLRKALTRIHRQRERAPREA